MAFKFLRAEQPPPASFCYGYFVPLLHPLVFVVLRSVAVFCMYFVFWLVCVSLSLGSLSCSLAFVFRFHIPFCLGLFILLLCMQCSLDKGFFARLRFICFISLLIVHLWELAAITSFLFRVVFAPLLYSRSFA